MTTAMLLKKGCCGGVSCESLIGFPVQQGAGPFCPGCPTGFTVELNDFSATVGGISLIPDGHLVFACPVFEPSGCIYVSAEIPLTPPFSVQMGLSGTSQVVSLPGYRSTGNLFFRHGNGHPIVTEFHFVHPDVPSNLCPISGTYPFWGTEGCEPDFRVCNPGVLSVFVGASASRGFGDTISKLTTALGIPKCPGCNKREAFLNRLLPYNG